MIHWTRGHAPRGGGLLLAAWLLAGCASPAPYRTRYADIGAALANYKGDRPLVVEFQAGDRLPLDLKFSGDDFELQTNDAALTVVAKRHCFVRFGGAGGVRVSSDGTDFDEKPRVPGSFFLGFKATPTQKPNLAVHINAPKR